MISWTNSVRRFASCCMRDANFSTDAGSSFADRTASLNNDSAPIGVFSSCEIFATKSRRTSCTRSASLSSLSRTRICKSFSSEITFTVSSRTPSPIGPRGTSIFPLCVIPVRRTTRTIASNSGLKMRPSFITLRFSTPADAKIEISPGARRSTSSSSCSRTSNKIGGASRRGVSSDRRSHMP